MSSRGVTVGPFAISGANDPRIASQPTTESAGSRLRSERQAQRISEKEAAHSLRLMVTDLRAIEADSYSASANDDMLRSYLRDYANFVKLNPDAILAIYDRQTGTSMHRGANRASDLSHAKSPIAGNLITGGLVVLTVVLAFLILMQFTDTQRVKALLTENSQDASAASQPADGGDATTASIEDSELAAIVIDIEQKATVTDDAAAAATTNSDSAGVARPQAMKVEDSVAAAGDGELKEVAASYQGDNSAGTGSAAADPGVTDELSFSFDKDCWVEVYDADEKRLIAEIRKAGAGLQLSGKSPFKVLVGYSREVALQFNGHPVEIEKINGSYSTLFKVGRADSEVEVPVVETIRRKNSS